MSIQAVPTSAADIRERLNLLYLERAYAEGEGLIANAVYAADLEGEIAATSSAYVGMAVTEIAVLRGQLSGPLQG
ncbi:MAG: hypothetical protein AVDCRST_MAG30-816 [uncultured Solirubrobacteraceae bacterium]|uniref:Uncharacterized protein n=1 Tax=uncultured Solirubrobacteraceae bacterium TaxID=1162706 RepID=A0A6J4RUK4_9ACTN|nr:MAG: hypothetical protein AVDCRST_MAG30-816 [uncultured Solirubrobacteraceae bacterium]